METDGRIRDGTTLQEAIELMDDETDTVHYMNDRAHPLHMTAALEYGAWRARVVGVRYVAST